MGQLPMPSGSNMTDVELGEHVYARYRAAKKQLRRWSDKPVRTFRRNLKFLNRRRSRGYGKGYAPREPWAYGGTSTYLQSRQQAIVRTLAARGMAERDSEIPETELVRS